MVLMGIIPLLRKGARKPELVARELNLRYYRIINDSGFNDAGVDYFDRDWDNLVLLDACRYDMFAEISELLGELSQVQSPGSCTIEFLRGSIAGRELHDTVYVTGNPVYYRNRAQIDAEFHHVVNVWQEEGWDEEHGTVLPKTMEKYAREAAAEFPNKRLLIHYIQPHYPFIGSGTLFDKNQLHVDPESRSEEQVRFWFQIFTGELDVSAEEIWDAYNLNLEHALKSVERLLPDLPGRTVVSSDHGNMIGERSFPLPITEWGHPCGLYCSQLTSVPWLVAREGERKEIASDPPTKTEGSIDSTTVTNRLNELGYLD